jgi:hypothetical protein
MVGEVINKGYLLVDKGALEINIKTFCVFEP